MSKEDLVEVESASYKSSSCVGTTCKIVVGSHSHSLSVRCATLKAEDATRDETEGTGV